MKNACSKLLTALSVVSYLGIGWLVLSVVDTIHANSILDVSVVLAAWNIFSLLWG